MNSNCPSFRIILLPAEEIYHAQYVAKEHLIIKNNNDSFDKHYSDVLAFNLDLLFLLEYEKKFDIETNSLKSKTINGEYYTDDFINVSFEYVLRLNEKKERVFKDQDTAETINLSTMRTALYRDGFEVNGKEYVRYKRSAGAAKGGSCLFIKKSLYRLMNSWSKAGLDEKKDGCLSNLTSYEAYKALSLSNLIKTFELNPYNILFVKDFKYILKDQEVVKVDYVKEEGLVASREKCDIENNLFDGEGLLDVSIFKECGYSGRHNKGMMLLRNRFFKCCAFNTNLQKWFKQNNITSTDQLNGYTFAKNIEDIVLVASESCLKYIKMCKGGKFSKESIKRWCDVISTNRESTFGIVKTDKETRFFDGDMVETTYQFLNTLSIRKDTQLRVLLSPYFEYINKIRNIKETPEYVKLFLKGEVEEERNMEINGEDNEDDSEDNAIQNEELNYTSYSFKNKICYEMLDINKDFKKTNLFKRHLFENIIDSFRLKLYDGRILVDGTYATLFGNPIEYLKYTIKSGDTSLLEANGVQSSLGKDEIYCSFFPENEEISGSRAPHMTMGNLLYAKNKKPKDLDKWFNLTRNIVVLDAINNNVQHRLNGADYDSDSMLLTNNKVIVEATYKNYERFPVPYTAFGPDSDVKPETKDITQRLIDLDHKIASNKVGQIVNLSQKLNSHLWNNLNKNDKPIKKDFNEVELYNKIAILAVLAGAEIDSAKKHFSFTTISVYNKIHEYSTKNGFGEDPQFFYYVSPDDSQKGKPTASKVHKRAKALAESGAPFFSTTMDLLWKYTCRYSKDENATRQVKGKVNIFDLVRDDITTKNLSKDNYKQIEHALEELKKLKRILYRKNKARKHSKSFDIEKRQFNEKIENCYREIKSGISKIEKTRKLIQEIEKIEDETPNTLLFVLLYLISVKEKELGYTYTDLFTNDGGIDGLVSTKKKNADFVLFDHYYYEKPKARK